MKIWNNENLPFIKLFKNNSLYLLYSCYNFIHNNQQLVKLCSAHLTGRFVEKNYESNSSECDEHNCRNKQTLNHMYLFTLSDICSNQISQNDERIKEAVFMMQC
jgi:hypothetical protein